MSISIGYAITFPDKFQTACSTNDSEFVKQELKSGHVITYVDIIFAIEYNQLDMVKLLLADPQVISTNERYVVDAACKHGNLEIVSFLFTIPEINSNYLIRAINFAFDYRHLKVVDFLFNLQEQDHITYLDGSKLVKLSIMGEDVYCHIENGKVRTSLSNFEKIVEDEYVKWQYRLGGEKWTNACNSLK